MFLVVLDGFGTLMPAWSILIYFGVFPGAWMHWRGPCAWKIGSDSMQDLRSVNSRERWQKSTISAFSALMEVGAGLVDGIWLARLILQGIFAEPWCAVGRRTEKTRFLTRSLMLSLMLQKMSLSVTHRGNVMNKLRCLKILCLKILRCLKLKCRSAWTNRKAHRHIGFLYMCLQYFVASLRQGALTFFTYSCSDWLWHWR